MLAYSLLYRPHTVTRTLQPTIERSPTDPAERDPIISVTGLAPIIIGANPLD